MGDGAIAGGYTEYFKVSPFSVVISVGVLIHDIQRRPGMILPSACQWFLNLTAGSSVDDINPL